MQVGVNEAGQDASPAQVHDLRPSSQRRARALLFPDMEEPAVPHGDRPRARGRCIHRVEAAVDEEKVSAHGREICRGS